MFDWNAVKELGTYLGLGIDDSMVAKLSSNPDNGRLMELLRLSMAGNFRKKYPEDTVDLLVKIITGTDLKRLSCENDRGTAFSRDVFGRLSSTVPWHADEVAYDKAFEEFDVVFQQFIRSFKAAFAGMASALGLKQEKVSLEYAGVKDYLMELKELPCRRLGELSFAHTLQGDPALSGYIGTLLKKYEDKAIARENCQNILEIMNKAAGYPGYYKNMDGQQKFIESRPILLAISELQLYPVKETAKGDLLSALGILLFNVFPAPKLLKFISKFEPSPENDLLSYEYHAILALNYLLYGKMAEAAAYNERALNFAMDEEKRAYTYILGSCIHLNKKDFDEALKALYNCSSVTRDGRLRATALFYMGIIHYEMGNVTDALDCFKKAGTGMEDDLDIMSVCNDIGTCAMVLGDLKEAIKAFESVDSASRFMSNKTAKELKSIAYGNLGIIHMSMRNYDRAMDYYKQALKLDKEAHDKKRAANDLGNIGLALKAGHDNKLALEYFKSSLSVSFSDDYLEGVIFSFDQIEQLMALEGRSEEAEAFKQEVIRRNPGIAKMLKRWT